MNNKVYKVLVLLKPGDVQPAVERAAEFARFVPELQFTAVRVINNVKESDKANAENSANRELLDIQKKHPSIVNFESKVIFSDNVANAFIAESKNGYDLAVISANKRHTIRDLFVSNIDSTIMGGIKIPLLVVQSASAAHRAGPVIMVAIDLRASDHDEKLDDVLVEKAKRFAEKFNGEVHLANCILPHNPGYSGRRITTEHTIQGGRTRADIRNDLVASFAKKHDIDLERCHVVEGRLDEELPRLANQLNARMICMGVDEKEGSGALFSKDTNTSELMLDQVHGDLFVINRQLV